MKKNFLLIKTEVPRHDWMVSYVGNVSYSGVRFILGTDYWRNGIKSLMKSRKIVFTYCRYMLLVNILHDHKNSIRAWNNFFKRLCLLQIISCINLVLETIYITMTLLETPLSLKVICMETFSFRDFHNFCKFANLTREFTYCMQS